MTAQKIIPWRHWALVTFAFVIIFGGGGMTYALWPRHHSYFDDDGYREPTWDEDFKMRCESNRWWAMTDLERAINRTERGDKEWAAYSLNQFSGRMSATLDMCFPYPKDGRPTLLVFDINNSDTPDHLRELQRIINKGWERSNIGGRWMYLTETPWHSELRISIGKQVEAELQRQREMKKQQEEPGPP